MHPLDQFRAFLALRAQGLSEEESADHDYIGVNEAGQFGIPDQPADLQDEPQASSDDPGDTGREFESESHGRPVGSPASQKPDPIAVRSGLLSDGFPA
ncbi:hypothetical protein [Rhizobium sp. BG4]|uniref:hypothetical protein n=1 Tax=Rhizobium sp. BG4 TaxID=2613770 RepID=UPI0032B1E378